jgi:competence protein ComEA
VAFPEQEPVAAHGLWAAARGYVADRLPTALRGGRVDPSPRGAMALAVVAMLAALVATLFAWRSRPSEVSVASGGSAPAVGVASPSVGPVGIVAPSVATPTPRAGATAGEIVVDVAGKVRRPGVVRLPEGSRVVDAVDRAGGVLPGTDTTGLALAQRLTDGEQILVDGRHGPAPPPAAPGGGTTDSSPAGSTASGAARAPVNLNTATVDQLDGLPGVGPVLAQRIVDWRTGHGSFTSTNQLSEVDGLGQKRLADLLPLVTV